MTTFKVTQNAPNLTLKSFDGGAQGYTSIINNLSYAIKLYWVDRNGVEVAYNTVPASGSIVRQSASIGNAWRIRDLDGNFVAEFYGDTDQIVLSKTGIEFTFDDSNLTIPKTTLSADEYIHQTFGYGIINVAKALGATYSEAPFTGSRITSYDNSAALKYINDYNLWKQGYDGKGVTVAVIGTGIDSNNIEFSGRIIEGYDFGNNDSNPIAGSDPHETGIAGIIAGSATLKVEGSLYDTIGVAPAASILNIKNMKDDGLGGTDSTIAQSIRYAVDHGAKVISLSQGNSGAYKSDELYSAAKYAQDHNVLIAVAAGNDFKDSLGIPAFAWIGLNNFIVVGNWNMDGYNLFSSSNKLGSVDVPYVVAPSSGWQVQLNNSYAYYEDGGTSSATPYVSGLAVLLFQQHPDWTPTQVISRITSTATSPYSLGVSLPSSTKINALPTGSVSITGTATQGQTLTATNNLADVDGLGVISYQWQADGSNISGATGSSFVLNQAQVGKAISVIASYTDGQGTAEKVSSSATAKVANINDTPTGSVSITGTATQGQTLTASNTLADVDGLGAISYQWQADGSNISGATGNTFALGQSQVGKVIGVIASYTDSYGTFESVGSTATAKVTNFNDVPTGAVTFSGSGLQGETLTATNSIADLDGLGSITYQWMRSGVAINGANAKTYVVSAQDIGESLSVRASYTDGYNTTETVTSKESVLGLPKSTITTTVVKGVISGTNDNDVFDTTWNTTAKYQGGKGDDSYTVNASGIVITESANQGTDTVFSGASYTLPLNVENLKLFGLNDITATGNKSNNLIVGNSANNLIYGLEGKDTLTGGAGKDTFVFSTALNAKTNVDTITDFNPGEDLIGLKASIFKKLGVGVEASELWLKNQGSVQTANQYLIYDSNSGTLSYDADGNGKGVAIPVAIIGTNLSLVAGDFVVLQ